MGCKACQQRSLAANSPLTRVSIEGSDSGAAIGYDTGYTFRSPRTGMMVRVIARPNESTDHAIARVRANHGL